MSRRVLRWLIAGMVLVGIVGVARVLLSASDSSEAWMRWAPSVELAGIEDGAFAVLDGPQPAVLSALTREQLDAVQARTAQSPQRRDPLAADPLEERILRVELDGRTRWFAIHAAELRRGCRVERNDDGWNDPCTGARYDQAGRTLDVAVPDLPTAAVLIRRGKLHLRPEQP